MARIDQGYYKKVLKRFQDIQFKNEDLEYICELNSIDDIEELWSCLERCNDLYVECNSLVNDLEALMNSQKFEMEKTEIKYENMIDITRNIKNNTLSRYKTCKSAFGAQFSDSEVQSIYGFEINRE